MQIMPTVSRHQMGFSTLDSAIATDNEVRLIDAFVDKLDMDQLEFVSRDKPKKGSKRKAANYTNSKPNTLKPL